MEISSGKRYTLQVQPKVASADLCSNAEIKRFTEFKWIQDLRT
jgi:hypothetical protein